MKPRVYLFLGCKLCLNVFTDTDYTPMTQTLPFLNRFREPLVALGYFTAAGQLVAAAMKGPGLNYPYC